MRKAIIAGNWKMHYTPEEAVKLVNELKPLVKDATCDLSYFCMLRCSIKSC